MNKYIVPICDIRNSLCWTEKITAASFKDCQEKLVSKLVKSYEIDDRCSYDEFVSNADKEDILIGKIEDIEEI